MLLVVCDATPLIYLAKIGRFELLHKLHEAIQLAIERSALLVIDEAHGREMAQRLHVKITGTIGLLIRSKMEGFVPRLREELDRLCSETTFRLSPAIYNEALRAVGESSSEK